jgi:hypothetical protein
VPGDGGGPLCPVQTGAPRYGITWDSPNRPPVHRHGIYRGCGPTDIWLTVPPGRSWSEGLPSCGHGVAGGEKAPAR